MSISMNDPELMKEFLTETNELLENLDIDLVSLESDPENQDLINRIFRAFHTIKGTSSFLGFNQLVELNHAAEDVLQLFRSGERSILPEDMDVILDAVDKIKELKQQVQENCIREIDLCQVLGRLEGIRTGENAASKAGGSKQTGSENRGRDSDGSSAESRAMQTAAAFQDGCGNTMRVDVSRLDDLMNLVGELVLERNRLLQINREFKKERDMDAFESRVAETTDKIHFITTELQLSVMKTRMIPIDRLFRKFNRLVRDIAREKEKEAVLHIEGGDTELEKSVIDQLGDPLVHLLRNSIDHGIEPPEARVRAGKPRCGSLVLSAKQVGNHILVVLKDDGRGIDIEKVKRKALEKGVVTESQLASMNEQSVIQLIFEPGFSTADQVSDLSGRGVGMDVVRTNIQNLNGMIDIVSHAGKGTEIILQLPLTLAVMQALMVGVGKEIYAIPLGSVIETLRVHPDEIRTVDACDVVLHREKVIPLLYVAELFQLIRETGEKRNFHKYVVLVGVAEKRFGLVVDRLLGQEEVVIKSLGDYMGSNRAIAGGTISGDGRVRLIIDCANLTGLVGERTV